MSDKVVLGEYVLPVWAIEMLESEEDTHDDERADDLYGWLESFESCGTPEVVVMDKSTDKVPHALFDGAKSPSKKVMLIATPSNVGKIKRYYATLGSDEFFNKLTTAQERFKEHRPDEPNIGMVSYEQWQTIAAECPSASKDLNKVVAWCMFNSPLCQLWTVWMLEQ
ncbi:hypothetical protein OTK49_03000 [Vibrio coralliirubri]|uniref:hypothetical protein n=1 Tax=Vibrio coralliirubri TaxID=1516159 RepID=UPI002283D4BB|nr:hypothetical protein [Vibrio coralliirubri]MCY9861483.1 hypothetical protein [Vibrio coralliirubri]